MATPEMMAMGPGGPVNFGPPQPEPLMEGGSMAAPPQDPYAPPQQPVDPRAEVEYREIVEVCLLKAIEEAARGAEIGQGAENAEYAAKMAQVAMNLAQAYNYVAMVEQQKTNTELKAATDAAKLEADQEKALLAASRPAPASGAGKQPSRNQ